MAVRFSSSFSPHGVPSRTRQKSLTYLIHNSCISLLSPNRLAALLLACDACVMLLYTRTANCQPIFPFFVLFSSSTRSQLSRDSILTQNSQSNKSTQSASKWGRFCWSVYPGKKDKYHCFCTDKQFSFFAQPFPCSFRLTIFHCTAWPTNSLVCCTTLA